MRIRCPACESELRVSKRDHYKMLECPICGKHFQAITKGTMNVALDFLDQIEKKNSEEGGN